MLRSSAALRRFVSFSVTCRAAEADGGEGFAAQGLRN